MSFLGTLLTSVAGPLLGGILDKKTNKANRAAAAGMSRDDRYYDQRRVKQDRAYFVADRASDRRYSEKQTKKDRIYAKALLESDRRYTQAIAAQDRKYQRDIQLADRRDERNYLAGRLRDDRAYADQQASLDRAEYAQDRASMQALSNDLAEKSAASRGVDFKRLVADAQAAGFNPLTAMGMAHAYSTNVDYQLQGGVYSNRANFQPSGAGYNAQGGGGGGGGGTAAPVSTPIASSPVAAGGFSSPGAGFTSNFQPAMSSGSFIAEAVDRAVTAFNRPPEKDVLAESLRQAMSVKEAQEQRVERTPRPFGYDLSAVEPFKPRVTVAQPALERGKPPAQAARPQQKPFARDQKFIPVRSPNGNEAQLDATIARRLDIQPWDTLSAGDYTELAGELVGEADIALRAGGVYETAFNKPFLRFGDDNAGYAQTGSTRKKPALTPYEPDMFWPSRPGPSW